MHMEVLRDFMQASALPRRPADPKPSKRDADAVLLDITPRAKRRSSQTTHPSPGIGTSPLTAAPSQSSEHIETAESFGPMLPAMPHMSLFRSAGQPLQPTPEDHLKASQEVSPLRHHDADAANRGLHPDSGLQMSGTMRVSPLQRLKGDTIGERLVPAMAAISVSNEAQSLVDGVGGRHDWNGAPLLPADQMQGGGAHGQGRMHGLQDGLEDPGRGLRPDSGLFGQGHVDGGMQRMHDDGTGLGAGLQPTDGLPVPKKAGRTHDEMNAAAPCQPPRTCLDTRLAASTDNQLPVLGDNPLGHGAQDGQAILQVPDIQALESSSEPSRDHMVDSPDKGGLQEGLSSSDTKIPLHERSAAGLPESSTNDHPGGNSNESWSSDDNSLAARPSRLGLARIPTVGSQLELTLALQGNLAESSLALNPTMSSQSTSRSSGGLAGPLRPALGGVPSAYGSEQRGASELVRPLGEDYVVLPSKGGNPAKVDAGRVLEPVSETVHNGTTHSSEHMGSTCRSSGPPGSGDGHMGKDQHVGLSPGRNDNLQVPGDEIEPHVEKLLNAMRRSRTNPMTGSRRERDPFITAPSKTLKLDNNATAPSTAEVAPDVVAAQPTAEDPPADLPTETFFQKMWNSSPSKYQVGTLRSTDCASRNGYPCTLHR